MGSDFLIPNSAYKMCHVLWPVGASRGFIGSAISPLSYTPSAFRTGVADIGEFASIFQPLVVDVVVDVVAVAAAAAVGSDTT